MLVESFVRRHFFLCELSVSFAVSAVYSFFINRKVRGECPQRSQRKIFGEGLNEWYEGELR